MSLARRLLALKTFVQLRATTAVVTDVAPFTIQLGDGVQITDPSVMGFYTPAVDDVVLVLRPDTSLVVIGNIV